MTTDNLINMLSTNVDPTDHRQISRKLGIAIGFSAVAALSIAILALGVRPALLDAGTLTSIGLKLLFGGIIVAVASRTLNRIVRPGGELKAPLVYISLPFVAIVLLAALALAIAPRSHWVAMLVGNQWLECLISIPLIAIVPFAMITWTVRQAAPTDLSRAGALVGLVAGSVSAIGYALHCTDDSAPFVALWYGGTIGLCTFAGWKLGPRLLRW